MKRLFLLFVALGLVGVLMYAHTPKATAQNCDTMDDSKLTENPKTTQIITLPASGKCLTISGKGLKDRGGKTVFIDEDSIEKTVGFDVTAPTVVTIRLEWANKDSDLDLFLFKLKKDADPALLGDADLFNADVLFTPATIRNNVLLPGRYFIGISNFECDTCNNNAPFDSPPTDFTLTITVGGTDAEVNVDSGFPDINRFRTGLGRTYVNRFSLTEELGLSAAKSVTVSAVRIFVFNGPDVGVQRPAISGQKVRFIAFKAAKGTTKPPDNPTLILDKVVTIPEVKVGAFLNLSLDPPLTVNSDDELFVGYFVADPANNGMNFNIDLRNPRNRTFFTGGPMTATAVLSGWQLETFTPQGGQPQPGNLMLRIVAKLP